MAWPSTITSFTNPLPSQKLNSPSHSSIETAQNTGLTEVQTFLGTMTSSALGTLIGTVYNPASDGGGHVQAANKGGTGFTSYTKGDLLVATSASALSKLAVGTDGQVLAANSSLAAGIGWSNANTFTTKIEVSASVRSVGASVAANSEQSVMNVVIPGSTLGINNAVRATIYVNDFQKNLTAGSVLLSTRYGGGLVGSMLLGGVIVGSPSLSGKIEVNLLSNASSVLQRANTYIDLKNQNYFTQGPAVNSVISGFVTGTSSVNTSADQVLGVTVRFQDNSPANYLAINGYIVEKIA